MPSALKTRNDRLHAPTQRNLNRVVDIPMLDAAVAVYSDTSELQAAVGALAARDYDMSLVSIVGPWQKAQGGSQSDGSQQGAANRWSGVWGWSAGNCIVVPEVGLVGVGGYLLFSLLTSIDIASRTALTEALTSIGIAPAYVPGYEAHLRDRRDLLIVLGERDQLDVVFESLMLTTCERCDHYRGLSATPHRESNRMRPACSH